MPSNTKEDPERDKTEKLPTKEKAWEEVMKRVEQIDSETEKGWKDDIDTLLVFAGLFSAVVTAFTIESYKWLSEDPSNQSVVILAQISAQLNNQNVTPLEPTPFTPSPSVIRINFFWFLSLILSLVDALFGLMCKQWIREYRRADNTQTPEQWLSLRCFRSESFQRWHVPSFLAALPIILEAALFCFFAGLLELLWMTHHVPFAIASVVIGCAVAFYIATTLLPGIDIIRLVSRVYPGFDPDERESDKFKFNAALSEIPEICYLCPYKSPQAWAMFKFIAWIFGPLVSHYLRKILRNDEIFWARTTRVTHVESVMHEPQKHAHWRSVDMNILERFSRIHMCPDMYEMRGYQWLTREFRDSPLMLPHLRALLRAVPPHLAMPAIFSSKIVRCDRDYTAKDVEKELTRRDPFDTLFSYSVLDIKLLYVHHLWITEPCAIDYCATELLGHGQYLSDLQEPCVPMTRIFQLMVGGESQAQAAIQYIEWFLRCRLSFGQDFDCAVIIPFLGPLATVDPKTLPHEHLLIDWLRVINEEHCWGYRSYSWVDALDIFRISRQLPDGFFRLLGSFPVSLDRLNTLLCDQATKHVALERMEDYKQICDADSGQSRLRYLGDYLFRKTTANLEGYPPQLRNELIQLKEPIETPTDEVPYLLTSQDGRSFLKSLNAIVKGRSPERDDDGLAEVKSRWALSLKCVAHVNGLPLDYFDSADSLPISPAVDDDSLSRGHASKTDEGENPATPVDPSLPVQDQGGGIVLDHFNSADSPSISPADDGESSGGGNAFNEEEGDKFASIINPPALETNRAEGVDPEVNAEGCVDGGERHSPERPHHHSAGKSSSSPSDLSSNTMATCGGTIIPDVGGVSSGLASLFLAPSSWMIQGDDMLGEGLDLEKAAWLAEIHHHSGGESSSGPPDPSSNIMAAFGGTIIPDVGGLSSGLSGLSLAPSSWVIQRDEMLWEEIDLEKAAWCADTI
ncbi:hypothetical protein PQX77_005530 [Marasmius sp. AFHP31]|nr:hypothetical protein PQX77_005530 [Marasmius sp. AFHP31]